MSGFIKTLWWMSKKIEYNYCVKLRKEYCNWEFNPKTLNKNRLIKDYRQFLSQILFSLKKPAKVNVLTSNLSAIIKQELAFEKQKQLIFKEFVPKASWKRGNYRLYSI
jgi:DNA modification methylase